MLRSLFMMHKSDRQILLSLLFIGATITVATVASLAKTRGDAEKKKRETVEGEPITHAHDSSASKKDDSAAH